MDKSRIEPTIFFIENISFSLKLFSGHFMGNPSLRLSEVLCSRVTGFLILIGSLGCLKEVKTMDMILGKCKFTNSFLPYFQ